MARLSSFIQVLALAYTVVFSALHYSILCSREDITFRTALGRVPEAAVSFILGILLLGPIMALLGYHLRVNLERRLALDISLIGLHSSS